MNAVTKHETPAGIVRAEDAPMVAMIERIAMDPSIPLDRLEQMLAMKERMDAKAAERAFAEAFSAASSEMPAIPMNGAGNNKKPYALLKDIIAYTRPVLARHGMILNFDVQSSDKITVTARLTHKDGHSQTTNISLPVDSSGSKNAVQSIGSSQTYGQRYTAQAILGLSLGEDTDDDGVSSARVADRITADQFVLIQCLMEESGADEGKMLAYVGAASLEELTVKQFDSAVSALRKKIAQKGGSK